MAARRAITTTTLKAMKQQREPIAVITSYDFPSAVLADRAGADVLLVGDSLGMVVLGYESTVSVTLEEMIHHTKAVARAKPASLIVADMPFATYHGSPDVTISNAARLLQQGLAQAVKLEGGQEVVPSIEACVRAGIPVMGHIGLTPQSVHQLGGYKVQGKDAVQAEKLLQDALALEEAGAFAIVLELIPEQLATLISERLTIPTIGIGAGRGCDGQVLVFHDLLQYGLPAAGKLPKFVKTYAAIGESMEQAIGEYVGEVKQRQFPAEAHCFSIEPEVIQRLYGSQRREAP